MRNICYSLNLKKMQNKKSKKIRVNWVVGNLPIKRHWIFTYNQKISCFLKYKNMLKKDYCFCFIHSINNLELGPDGKGFFLYLWANKPFFNQNKRAKDALDDKHYHYFPFFYFLFLHSFILSNFCFTKTNLFLLLYLFIFLSALIF